MCSTSKFPACEDIIMTRSLTSLALLPLRKEEGSGNTPIP